MTSIEPYEPIYDDIYGGPTGEPFPEFPPPFEPILFPDIIKLVVDYLTMAIPAGIATAHSRVPNPMPDNFFTVERTGGPRQTIVTDGAQVTLGAWSRNLPEDAYALAQLGRARINAMQNTVQQGVTVYGVHELAGPGLLPDPISEDTHRYVWTVQIVTRGVVLNIS